MKKIFRNIFDNLAACIVPTIPVLLGAGLLKIFIILVGPNGLKILSETNSTYIVFSFVTNSAYYFLPIFTAVSSGEHFKMDKYLAGLIGAMLIAPEFVELVNNGTKLNVFGLPIASTSYASQVLPPVIAIYVASIIYRF